MMRYLRFQLNSANRKLTFFLDNEYLYFKYQEAPFFSMESFKLKCEVVKVDNPYLNSQLLSNRTERAKEDSIIQSIKSINLKSLYQKVGMASSVESQHIKTSVRL